MEDFFLAEVIAEQGVVLSEEDERELIEVVMDLLPEMDEDILGSVSSICALAFVAGRAYESFQADVTPVSNDDFPWNSLPPSTLSAFIEFLAERADL